MFDYLFSVHAGFGPLSWLAMLAWLAALGAGGYLYGVWQERNPVRARFVRRFGLVLSVLGALGLLLLFLKALGIPVLSWPAWSYLAMLATLLFVGWAVWFYQTRVSRMVAAASARGAARGARGARTYTAPGNGSQPSDQRPAPPPRPVSTTGRREARRERKRRGR